MRITRQIRAQATVELGVKAIQVAEVASSGFRQKTVALSKLSRAARKVAEQLDSNRLVLIIAAKPDKPTISKEVNTLADLVSFVAEILESYGFQCLQVRGYQYNDSQSRFEKKVSPTTQAIRQRGRRKERWPRITDEQIREEIRHLL